MDQTGETPNAVNQQPILGCQGVSVDQENAYLANYQTHKVGISIRECVQVYDEQAVDYEKNLSIDNYQGPVYAAQTVYKYYEDRLDAEIIDVAAGTGFVGEKLKSHGFYNIDALDPSQNMLKKAIEKCIYRTNICSLFGEADIGDDAYDCLVIAGGMGEGHIPCSVLDEMIRITKPNGHVIIVMREEYLSYVKEYKDRLEPLMADLEKRGAWKRLERTCVPNYSFGKNGIIFVFKIL